MPWCSTFGDVIQRIGLLNLYVLMVYLTSGMLLMHQGDGWELGYSHARVWRMCVLPVDLHFSGQLRLGYLVHVSEL